MVSRTPPTTQEPKLSMLAAFPKTHTIWCLICSSGNQPSVIPSLCLMCYAACVPKAGHNHDVAFYACNLDTFESDTRLEVKTWIVRRNASKKVWYEHRQSRYKTYMRPMTAICGLPSGWQQKKDPEGKIYYESTTTGQLCRTLPEGLPLGWREAKDPDGKSFFVHDELQLASWHRPGKQPVVNKPGFSTESKILSSIGNTTNALVAYSKPDAVNNAVKVASKSSLVAVKVNEVVQAGNINLPSLENVMLQTATEATSNLIDNSEASILRNTKIATHIAHKGVTRTVSAIKNNKHLRSIARETGITAAKRHAKIAWTKAGKELLESKDHTIGPGQHGSQGMVLQEAGDMKNDGYVIEYDDGTSESYSADGKLQNTIRHQTTNEAHASQRFNSGQQSGGKHQHQHHSRHHQNQSPVEVAKPPSNADSSTGSATHPGLENSTPGLGAGQDQDQSIYAGQTPDSCNIQDQDIAEEQDIYADQAQDGVVAQDQYFVADQGFDNAQDTYVGQTDSASESEAEQDFGQEYDPGVVEEVDPGEADVNVVVDISVEVNPSC
jgi:hypothetical protein